MDSAVNDESRDGDNVQSECVVEVASIGEKRPVENGETDELDARSTKKANCGAGELRRVAEIVLVLSTMAGMRGGRSPTEAEVNMMAEARAKLVEICQDLAPKDLVARDAIGTVIEDLGLNWKIKDQRLGFRGSRLSIKEKLSLTKRKMEESKKFTAPSAPYSSQVSQPGFVAMGDTRGPSHSIRMFSSDKPSNAPLHSGNLPTSSTLGHVSAATSTSGGHQLLATEARPSTVSAGLPNSHPGRGSSILAGPRVEKVQFKSEGSNGTSYAPQSQANASANVSANQPLLNASTWSLQSHSMSSAKSTPENKVLNHNATKADGTTELGSSHAASQSARDQAFRPFIAQNTPANLPSVHQPMQGMKYVQPTPFFNNHNDIAKIVQKLLHPKLPEHPTWTPPSREYMNKPLTCQMCKVTVNEVETVVLCDACEKGFHLKCLEAMNQKGIPRGGEWHCLRCTALSNGKPLPPKYGRVMRSITPPKGPSNPAGAQPSSDKKNGTVDPNVNQEKLLANGSSGLQNPAGSSTASDNCAESAPDGREMTGNSIIASVKNVDQGTCTGNPNNLTKSVGVVSDSPSVGLSSERSIHLAQVSESHTQEETSGSEPKLQPPAILSEVFSNKFENSKPSNDLQHIARAELSNASEVPFKSSQGNFVVEDLEFVKGNSDCTSTFDVKQSEQVAICANPVESSEPSDEARKHAGMSSDVFHSVEWIGDAVKVSDGKTFYQSCFIDGVTYKVQDHALFRSSHEKLMPSKLQAMWEDIETGTKWVLVNRCYFPGDLPKAVGHPCASESNEVYESNHESSLMAGLIQGQCKVLPSIKFQINSERQNQLGTEANIGSDPVFICKWFYDESKGTFQPVFS
ncbi:hypothetical protein JCGZ_00959 [Jatropha curcas]|uniref:PHD-type domain-containing protein n=1 Tax=Jatropha curcas TaxID=180498 RepID=A0A067KSW4_JATCU|nr:uncharacterized protein LOC105633025 [Jatropha curcas]KDP39202.1 hypothetical protein JCGZ_00959 [Jatropha curcas]